MTPHWAVIKASGIVVAQGMCWCPNHGEPHHLGENPYRARSDQEEGTK